MNKKRLFILTALMLAVCLVFTMFAVACDDSKGGDDGDKDNSSSNLLFTNGTFTGTGDNTELSAPNSWTGSVGSSSSSTATPSGDSNLRYGVADTATSAWRALRRKYSDIDIASPGRGPSSDKDDELDDSKVLMIYNKKATSYKYTSTSHSLDVNSYYKLSVDVKTMLDADNTDPLAGAYISVTGGAEAEWKAINTNGEWRTYELYIESSEISNGSISVVLSNGIGNTQTGHMSKGYAFFDNVKLEKVSEVDEDDENAVAFDKAAYDNVQTSATVAKYSMKLANANFYFASSTTSIPYTPSKYSMVAGFGSGENASTSSTYIARGLLDTSTFASEGTSSSLSSLVSLLQSQGKTLADLNAASDSDTRMLYMQNKQETAFGYRASTAMNFATNKFYKLSVWARTEITKGEASIRLTDGTNEDSNNYTLTAMSQGEWTEFTFYIEANQFRNTSLFLELWLGWGGQNDKDSHAVGAAFFDNASLTEITREQYNSANVNANTDKKISLLTSEENMSSISLDGLAIQNEKDVIANRSVFEILNAANFNEGEYFKENPGKPVDVDNSDIFTSKVLGINNYLPSSTVLSTFTAPEKDTSADTSKLLNIEANKAYAISMYVKTKDVDKSKGVSVSLIKYNDDYKGTDFSKMYSQVSEFSNLNTENLESNKGFNDYTLITFYVLGAQIKDTKIGISVSLGSGNGSDYSTLTMGYAYVSSMYLETIAYSQYTSATASTVIKKVSLADSAKDSEVSSNGLFNFTDIGATVNLHGDKWSETPVLALPTGWTSNNSSAISTETVNGVYPNMAGILNLNNADQTSAFNIGDINTFYNGAERLLNVEKYPNVLAIKKNDEHASLGFTSGSISLSANSFYEFKVWAKAEAGNQFSIILKTATASDEDYKFAVITGDGNWHEYSIFVETGISSTSVTLSLNAGFENASPADSIAYFAHATYSTVDETVYENAKESEDQNDYRLTQSWTVDSFDDVESTDSLSSPKNFTGDLIDSEASKDEDDLANGVIDRNKTDFSDLDIDTETEEGKALYNAIFNNENTQIGNRVLAIYNKDYTSYGYTSNSATISGGKYYKISIRVLTYGLNAKTDKVNEKFVPTANITLKANNKTYEFGRKLTDKTTDTDQKRIVNTSTYEDGKEVIGKWTEYSFYIFAEENISSTTATLTVGLGFNSEDYRMKGYVFVDNFSVNEISEEEFIARKVQYGEDENGNYYKDGDNYVEITESNPAPAGATRYKKLTDSEVADIDNSLNSELADESKTANNFRIVFTSDDSNAEPTPEDPDEDDEKKNSYVWVYAVSGVVSGLIVVIVVIFLIKKYAPKRKKKLVKSNKSSNRSSGSGNSKRDQFGK